MAASTRWPRCASAVSLSLASTVAVRDVPGCTVLGRLHLDVKLRVLLDNLVWQILFDAQSEFPLENASEPFAEEALEAGDSGPWVDGGVVHGVLADEDGAVVGEGDPGGDAVVEHGLGRLAVLVAGDAGVSVAQVDGDDSRPGGYVAGSGGQS